MEKTIVDVIILSYTKNLKMYQMTFNAIDTLLRSEQNIKFNIILIETNTQYKTIGEYPCEVITPGEKFNYNRFMNFGLKKATSEYIVLSNNDVKFHNNWFTNIVSVMNDHNIDSASPYCPTTYKNKKHRLDVDIHMGYAVCEEIFGWCIVARKKVFDTIGLLDETFNFYMQDEDYARQIKAHNFKHGLVIKSRVDHLMSQSHSLIDSYPDREDMTNGGLRKFEKKYNIPPSGHKFL